MLILVIFHPIKCKAFWSSLLRAIFQSSEVRPLYSHFIAAVKQMGTNF